MSVHEQGLGAQGRRAALAQPQLTLLCSGQSQAGESLYFQSDFIVYICSLLKLHLDFSMGGAPSQLRGGGGVGGVPRNPTGNPGLIFHEVIPHHQTSIFFPQ